MSECIIAKGVLSGNGYGQVYKEGRHQGAHRWAYKEAYGKIPDGLMVRHMCNNKACINPAHLKVGTQKDNIQDCISSGNHDKDQRHGRANTKERVLPKGISYDSERGNFKINLRANGKRYQARRPTLELAVLCRKTLEQRHWNNNIEELGMAKGDG